MIKKEPFWDNENFRLQLAQCVVFICVAYLFYSLYSNLQHNLNSRGITSGFEFLNDTAGFNIIMHLIDYNERSTYLRTFLVGLLNTLLVSSIGIVIATILGVIIGVARVSHNWLWSKLALVYVEALRNIPLLLQIFFWYFVVLRAAPHPKQAVNFGDVIYITNRGIYLPKPEALAIFALVIFVFLTYWVLSFIAKQLLKRHSPESIGIRRIYHCQQFLLGLCGVGMIGILWQTNWNIPELRGFNFQGGFVLIPEFLALLFALSLYTAAFIAEIVRSGILAIPKGQWEAAKALGLNARQVMKLVILPQATKVILPPLTNQYLNLSKNSSLAAAVAYPDLISVFAGTVLNQTGQAIEIIGMTMAVYLTISLSISFVMFLYEKKTNWG
tara:strand:- start:34786 stop:35940 length:1155 start_codon:yes stop_codon:yes gene_type:complete